MPLALLVLLELDALELLECEELDETVDPDPAANAFMDTMDNAPAMTSAFANFFIGFFLIFLE